MFCLTSYPHVCENYTAWVNVKSFNEIFFCKSVCNVMNSRVFFSLLFLKKYFNIIHETLTEYKKKNNCFGEWKKLHKNLCSTLKLLFHIWDMITKTETHIFWWRVLSRSIRCLRRKLLNCKRIVWDT